MLRVLAALALCATSLAAQGVRGIVVDQASRQPIAGAVVFLLDQNDGVVGRDLTSETGAYRLSAPRPGTYRMRTLRIGFRPVVSAPVTLNEGPDVSLDLGVESIPVVLTAVKVERRPNCPVRQDASPAYNAWNEVVTALNAALLSTRMRNTSATIVAYDRWTEPGSEVVLRQGANVRSELHGQPWRSVSADSLHRAGFVVREANGWYTFHALDLDVLLSDVFLQDHCLSLGGVDNGQIPLELTPSRDRSNIAEIRGFVWLSATTLELKRLQYRYVNVLRLYEQADAGGDLEFLKLRNGSWIISKWQIRMPTSFRQRRSDSYGTLRGSPEVVPTEVKTTGGDVLRVLQRGDTIWSLPARTFEGRVLDSATSRPIPGARVEVLGTGYSATTSESGRFRIEQVLPGAYTVRVYTPMLDSLATFHRTTAVFASQLPSLDIRVPNRRALLERWCPALARGEREISGPIGMVLGVMRNQSDSTPVPNAAIAVEWVDAIPDAAGAILARPRSLKAETDSQGVYRACGPPWDHRLKVHTALDGPLPALTIRIGTGGVRRQDFWIRDGFRVADSATLASMAPAGATAQALQPVEVTAERVAIPEFEDRRALGLGRFVTREDLLKMDQRRMAEVFALLPGLRVWRSRTGSSAWVASGRGAGRGEMPSGDVGDQRRGASPACYVDVWLDETNVYSYRLGAPLFDVNSLRPNQIEAIEVYASPTTIPMRYARGATEQCGALIIWTRR